jgi:hypothetical protein
MIAHLRSVILAVLFAIPLIAVACDKVPLLAPTGTVITLIPESPTASLNSTVNIIATVIENGTAAGTGQSTKGAGTPVQNGTVVNFTTTLGSIEPAEARTHNGQVTVRLVTSNQSGTATITAYSGGTSAQKDINVGAAAAGRILLTATPSTLGSTGGTAQVTATVTDATGRAIGNVPVTFTTDKGTVNPATATTDANGVATTFLNTTTTSKVTAKVGSQSVDLTVNVNARIGLTLTAEPTSSAVGVPIKFTITTAETANVQSASIDYGDGSVRDLGAIGKTTTISHPYGAPGIYSARATARDANGSVENATADVVIGVLPVTVTATQPTAGAPVTATVGGIPDTAQVLRFEWSASDGQTAVTTGKSWTTTFAPGAKVISVRVIGLTGTVIGSASTTINVT